MPLTFYCMPCIMLKEDMLDGLVSSVPFCWANIDTWIDVM